MIGFSFNESRELLLFLRSLIRGFFNFSKANLLILLSDIDGLYDKDPNINPDAKHLALIKEVTRKMLNMASQTTSENSKYLASPAFDMTLSV